MAAEHQKQEPRKWFQIPEPESDGSCRHAMSNPAWCAICVLEAGRLPSAHLSSPMGPPDLPTARPAESSPDPGKQDGSHTA